MHSIQMNLAGRLLRLETGDIAKQASGAVMIRYGDTLVLATCVGADKPREGVDFFPLTVDYEEKLYAAGKIPGSWFRKEGRPTEKCILTSRLIDRPIRPLFPKDWKNDVQIVASVMSADQENDPDIPALIGTSAALLISDIPFLGPVGAVRIGIIENEFVVNPTTAQREISKLDLIVAGTKEAVTMIEAGAAEVSEEDMMRAIQFAHGVIKDICVFQEELQKLCGKMKKVVIETKPNSELEAMMRKEFIPEVDRILTIVEKKEREKAEEELSREKLLKLLETYPNEIKEKISALLQDEKNGDFDAIKHDILSERLRHLIVKEKRRPDGRQFHEIRPITCSTGLLPRTHGSAIFTRGQTQLIANITLGAPSEEQTLDGLLPEEKKRFILHYYMPPYSVGEVKPLRGPGRREIGHGALAERALSYLLPSEEDFPYVIRVVCEAVESNGSTSMASVCSGSLAMFDAGVPLKKPVAGIAMGLVHLGSEYSVLTDIQGLEDHLGEMDFKVAGTADGITALQLDIKLTGVEMEVLQKALYQAKEAREFILGVMNRALSAPKPELSPYAPRIITLAVPPDRIKDVIGSGGKTINKIIAETKVKIDIEDDGRIFIVTPDAEGAQKAKNMIEAITREVEEGEIYHGTVTRLMNFGAFVEIYPGKEGLVHISQIGPGRVERVEDVFQVGDKVTVKVLKIDEMGRVNLTCKGIGSNGEQSEDQPNETHEHGSHDNRSHGHERKPFRDPGREHRSPAYASSSRKPFKKP
ncbi:MAG: polyribonucleotide nucleotidyltransferase [Candidatus Eremiobacteraeota bacterium]|nr:polyribonucleotide nucleotidyltransferase [Candidatus Eremiobacteraeota bacterium]MCL5054532.1 polyribonucleotide nucleotidyltransferase [Bacillota bacterium]